MAATASALVTSTILGTLDTITPSLSSGSSNSTAGSATSTSGGPSLSAGAIAGIVIGTLVGVALVVFLIWFLRRRSKKSRLGYSSTKAFLGSEGANSNEKSFGSDGSYIQPSTLATGAGARGLRNANKPHSPDGADGVPSELPSSPKAKAASEVHASSLFPSSNTIPRSPPDGPYEMPAGLTRPQPHHSKPTVSGAGGVAHEAPSDTSSSHQMHSRTTGRANNGNFKFPVSELCSDEAGMRQSIMSRGSATSPAVSRKDHETGVGSVMRKDDGR